jgi:hypothetical protein
MNPDHLITYSAGKPSILDKFLIYGRIIILTVFPKNGGNIHVATNPAEPSSPENRHFPSLSRDFF